MKEPKLPVRQLTILAICRFAEPIALTSVFPYLPEMIESFDVPKNEVAKWAGITSAAFSLSQCVTGIAWGRASDHFGRKPVILLGLSCTMLASIVFGLSESLPWAIVARSFAGASSGTVGILRTAVAEMVPQKVLQPRAFSIMPLVWSIGSIFGPTIGGALARPASKYPMLFGNSTFFTNFPFALPNLVASLIFVVGIATGFLFLHETLEERKNQNDYGRSLGNLLTSLCFGRKRAERRRDAAQRASLLKSPHILHGSAGDHGDLDHQTKAIPQAPPSFREVFSPQSNINLLAYSLLACHAVAFDQLLPVFLHLPELPAISIPKAFFSLQFAGGFGLESGRIGILFTIYGVAGMIFQFFVFPPVARRYGVLRCFKICSVIFPMVYCITPFTVLLPGPIWQQSAIILVMLVKCMASIFAFPCSIILLTNSARSLRLLGTLNGVSTSLSAIGRAAGPGIGGVSFTMGINLGYVIIPWWTLASIATLGCIPIWWLIEMEGFGDGTEDADDEDEEDHTHREPNSIVSPPRNEFDVRPLGLDGAGTGAQLSARDSTESAIEDESFGLDLSRQHSKRSCSRSVRMTVPLGIKNEGIGPGGRRYSNGVGQAMNGLGAGGTSYT